VNQQVDCWSFAAKDEAEFELRGQQPEEPLSVVVVE
jgi:hypothetical protein